MVTDFNVVYAKVGCGPHNIFFSNKKDVINFIIDEFYNIDFISINDNPVDISLMIQNNLKLSRFLKLKRSYDI